MSEHEKTPRTPTTGRRRLDFSKLEQPLSTANTAIGSPAPPKNQINVVLELPLDEIEEDPEQPRQEFDEEGLHELAADIKNRNVQQPINVRPKGPNGKHRIIHGARRYRGSRLAGKTTIPAIVRSEDGFDDYSQVTENTQRVNLSALDLARFIQKKKAAGESGKAIAQALSISESAITRHLSLLDAPESLLDAFKSGRINGVVAFHEFIKLQESYPEAAASLILGGAEITLSMIRSARKAAVTQPDPVTADSTPTEGPSQTPWIEQPETSGEHPVSAGTDATETQAQAPATAETLPLAPHSPDLLKNTGTPLEALSSENFALAPSPQGNEVAPPAKKIPFHNSELDKKTEPTKHDPSKIKKPLLLGKHCDREIKVLLQRTPSEIGLAHIQYEDTMEEAEVAIGEIQLTMLCEMRQQEKA